MLQTSLLFLRTADGDKNHNEELELSSVKASFLSDISNVLAIYIVISSLGLIGNGIIIWLLSFIIRKTKFTAYVVNMAAADFLILMRSFADAAEVLMSFSVNIYVKKLLLIMFFFGHETNSYFLAAMSTERCLAVFFPGWYQSHRRQCSTAFICVFLWILSVTLTMLGHYLCSTKYVSPLIIKILCKVARRIKLVIAFAILTPTMAFSSLALLIRMKRKPQQDFPGRLDISICVTVILHLILYPLTDIVGLILSARSFRYNLEFHHLIFILYCLGSAVNPYVYLLVGCWKRERGQEPCYKFLEIALKDKRMGRMGTQPEQQQA